MELPQLLNGELPLDVCLSPKLTALPRSHATFLHALFLKFLSPLTIFHQIPSPFLFLRFPTTLQRSLSLRNQETRVLSNHLDDVLLEETQLLSHMEP